MRPQQKTQKESNGNSNWTAESCNRENKVCCSFAGEILLLSSSLLTSTSVAPPRKALQSMLALEPKSVVFHPGTVRRRLTMFFYQHTTAG